MAPIHLRTSINTVTAAFLIFVILFLTLFCQIANFPTIIPLLLVFLGLHLFYFGKASVKLFLNLGLLLTLITFTANFLLTYTKIPPLYIPVASVSMLTMLLYSDLQMTVLMAFMSATIIALIAGGGLNLMLTFFIGSLTAGYTVREARNRGKLIGAGVYIGLMQAGTVILLNPDLNFLLTKTFFLNYLRPLLVNGFVCAFVTMATLKIFEYLFGALTNFSLLELCDFDHPLLKRMRFEAPGTREHSQLVSTLAEAAAESIGANALLTRVGAYYHDIGKLVKPEYFTENQLYGYNKHDGMEPSMSRLVILNHVKEGIELARKYKLNQQIIDFIPQHHGTSLIHYFYQKALEEGGEEDISEANFRYPGPKPQSRETAIVMLADSSEGATRAIEDPTPPKIEEVVRKVINNKFIDGQLDECNLTLKEIEKIAVTFTRVLSAMYHTRVKYPEKKPSNGNSHQKPAEENPHGASGNNSNR